MNSPLHILIGLVCSASVLSACGGSTSDSRATPVQRTDFANGAVSAFCGGYGTCCASKGFAFNAAACDSNSRAQLGSTDYCPAPAVYDPQAAGDCFAQMQASYAACSPNAATTSACQRMCVGSLPVGAACTSPTDCAPASAGTMYCMPDSNSGMKVCTVKARGKAGDGCTFTCTESADGSQSCIGMGGSLYETSDCYTNDGLFCASDGSCKALIPLGADCLNPSTAIDEYFGCAPGTHCSGICVANVDVGSPCPSGNECNNDAYCNTSGSTYVCVRKKAGGERCTDSSQCLGYCDLANNQCVGGLSPFNVTADSCANPTSI